MKLDDSRRSDNVEDDRGSGGGFRGVHLGIVGTLVVVGIGYFMGISPRAMLSLLNGGGVSPRLRSRNHQQLRYLRRGRRPLG